MDFWQVHYHHQWKWFEVVPFMLLSSRLEINKEEVLTFYGN